MNLPLEDIFLLMIPCAGGAGSLGGGCAPSRVLPNKPYAAAVPTTLTHDAFHTLCSPTPVSGAGTAKTGRDWKKIT